LQSIQPLSILHLLRSFVPDTATTEIYTLSLHDALPISMYDDGSGFRSTSASSRAISSSSSETRSGSVPCATFTRIDTRMTLSLRSEEHTSELQSLAYLVCRLLLEKKKQKKHDTTFHNTT